MGISKLKPCFISRTMLVMFTKLVGSLSTHVSIDLAYSHKVINHLIKSLHQAYPKKKLVPYTEREKSTVERQGKHCPCSVVFHQAVLRP